MDTYVGLYHDEEKRHKIEREERDVAVQAVRQGFIALAPNTRGFAPANVPDITARHGARNCRSQLSRWLCQFRRETGGSGCGGCRGGGEASLLPLALLYLPATGRSRTWISVASLLVITGGLAQMYIIIIGGQAYPMDMFPGKEVTSTFFDGVVASYSPSLPEVILGIGGVSLALAATFVGIRVLRFLPTSLADEVVDPHHSAKAAA